MISRRLLGGAAAVGLVASVAVSTAASAQPTYPPVGPSISVSATVAHVGTTITLSGSDFLPRSIVRISSFVSSFTPLEDTQSSPQNGSVAAGPQPVPRSGTAPQRLASHDGAKPTTTQDEAADTDADGGPQVSERGFGGRRGCATFRVCRVRTNADGDFSVPFFLKKSGDTNIVVRGLDQNRNPVVLRTVVRVLPRRHHHHHHHHGVGGGPSQSLPNTGTPVLGASAAGLVLLVTGTGLVVVARRRRVRTTR